MYLFVYVLNPKLEPNLIVVEWNLTSVTQTSDEGCRRLHYDETKDPSNFPDCASFMEYVIIR